MGINTWKSVKWINLVILLVWVVNSSHGSQPALPDFPGTDPDKVWKIGVARAVITPPEYMWMAGFAARDKPAEGILHDLWAKAIVFEDKEGERGILITTDIIGFDRRLSLDICSKLQRKFGLDRKSIILSSSHTHSGPVMNDNLSVVYPPFDSLQTGQIRRYRQFITEQILLVAERAVNSASPAWLSRGMGISRFAVNRRETGWQGDVLHNPDVRGPSDHVVEVLKVMDPETGKARAVVFGYSCHATCLSLNRWSGDWPGFAQIELEKNHPDLVALFFSGFGADQNAYPRGEVSQAEQYGRELAVAVEKVMKDPDSLLSPSLKAIYAEIELDLAPAPSKDELESIMEKGSAWEKRWAELTMEKVLSGETLPGSYPHYPIQSWQLGEQKLVVLGGEVVVDYVFRLRDILGNDLMIMGYANDVMAYIPSERILAEGGYEGEASMRAYGHRGNWVPGLEEKIIAEVIRQTDWLDSKQQDKDHPEQ